MCMLFILQRVYLAPDEFHSFLGYMVLNEKIHAYFIKGLF
jgi:hypothetical protein